MVAASGCGNAALAPAFVGGITRRSANEGVAGLVTGAANAGGFKGLAGRFGRQGLLRFGVPMTGDIRFTRLDTGRSVELAHRHRLERGDVLFRNGEPARGIYVIVHGTSSWSRPRRRAAVG